jgi:hypothetical protein
MDGVDVPLGFCRTLEPFLALRARVRLFGFVLSISIVSDKMVDQSASRDDETYTSSSLLWKCLGFLGQQLQTKAGSEPTTGTPFSVELSDAG